MINEYSIFIKRETVLNMKLTTNLNESAKLKEIELKAQRLCKLHKCGIIDLIVMSIDIQAENNKAQKNNN